MQKMKNSNIPWIGKIPEEWEVVRLRFLVNISTGDKDTINRNPEGAYPFYVRSPNIERIDSYSYDGEAILMAGDGVGAGKVFHYVNGKFGYHQRVYNLHNFKTINAKFLFYYLRENFIKKIEENSAKSTVDSVRLPMLLDFPVIMASLPTQTAIANFLDKKTNLIDDTIAKQKLVIEKLKLYKQSVITEAVTKGLNPNAPMKESGIEWIGKIPEGWSVDYLKTLAMITSSKRVFEEDYVDNGVPFFRSKEIVDLSHNIAITPINFISDDTYNKVSSIVAAPKAGDLLLTAIGTIGNIWKSDGRKFYYKDGNIIQIRVNENIHVNFLQYCFYSSFMKNQYTQMSIGSTLFALTITKAKKITIPLPPLQEQTAIADYLEKKTSQIDTVISQKEALIEKLTSYKQSLIFEAVTGKMEV